MIVRTCERTIVFLTIEMHSCTHERTHERTHDDEKAAVFHYLRGVNRQIDAIAREQIYQTIECLQLVFEHMDRRSRGHSDRLWKTRDLIVKDFREQPVIVWGTSYNIYSPSPRGYMVLHYCT